MKSLIYATYKELEDGTWLNGAFYVDITPPIPMKSGVFDNKEACVYDITTNLKLICNQVYTDYMIVYLDSEDKEFRRVLNSHRKYENSKIWKVIGKVNMLILKTKDSIRHKLARMLSFVLEKIYS